MGFGNRIDEISSVKGERRENKEMNPLSTKKSILLGFGMFGVVVLSLIFIGAPLQGKLGMVGLLLTELIFLALAIGGVLLTKDSFKEVFPFKIPTLSQTIAALILWAGTYLLVVFATIVTGYFFPDALNQTTSGMNGLMASIPFWARFLIVAVSPAICEEAIHRGFILHHLKPMGKKWLVVLVMGVLFGVFHLDPTRFLTTGILGAIMTYVALETDNMFYPMLIHFVNNALSVISTKITEGIESIDETYEMAVTLSTVGVYMMILCMTPWLLWVGVKLLHPKMQEMEELKRNVVKKRFICAVISLACLVGGGVITAWGITSNRIVSDMRTVALTELSQTPSSYDFTIEEAGTYELIAVINTPEELLAVGITDTAGNVVHEFAASQLTANFFLELKAGSYHMEVSCINYEGEFSVKPESMGTFNLVLQKR